MAKEQISVLIADDNREFAMLLKANLAQFNCVVKKMVHDGSQVYAAIMNSKPDVIFLDINMPQKSGLDILTDMRKDGLPHYVVIISGESKATFAKKAEERGANNYIEKPYKLENLKRVIEDYKRQPKLKRMLSAIIADDEPLMREVLKNNLAELGCHVVAEAGDGEQVLQLLQKNVPDILFLDIQMPNMDGLELIEKIKQKNINVFIAVVSGHGSYDNVKIAIDHGVNAFVVKPYSQKKIAEVIAAFDKAHP